MSATKLRTWAKARIEDCRKIEQKFCNLPIKGKRPSTGTFPQVAIEAWTERMTLQNVLSILDEKDDA